MDMKVQICRGITKLRQMGKVLGGISCDNIQFKIILSCYLQIFLCMNYQRITKPSKKIIKLKCPEHISNRMAAKGHRML